LAECKVGLAELGLQAQNVAGKSGRVVPAGHIAGPVGRQGLARRPGLAGLLVPVGTLVPPVGTAPVADKLALVGLTVTVLVPPTAVGLRPTGLVLERQIELVAQQPELQVELRQSSVE